MCPNTSAVIHQQNGHFSSSVISNHWFMPYIGASPSRTTVQTRAAVRRHGRLSTVFHYAVASDKAHNKNNDVIANLNHVDGKLHQGCGETGWIVCCCESRNIVVVKTMTTGSSATSRFRLLRELLAGCSEQYTAMNLRPLMTMPKEQKSDPRSRTGHKLRQRC